MDRPAGAFQAALIQGCGRPFLAEQNTAKASKWTRFAREGREVAWEFDSSGGAYTGRMLIHGEIYFRAALYRLNYLAVSNGDFSLSKW